MDFYTIKERSVRKDLIEIYPDFRNAKVEDLLVRGSDFYAVWKEETGLWSTDILDVQRIIDRDLWAKMEELRSKGSFMGMYTIKSMESESSGSWNRFKQYLKRYPDTKIRLDTNLTFQNTPVKKSDYVSKRLPYALEEGDYSAWDKLVGTLYSPSEREKIEWAIGAVVSGDSKTIQKFCVFYGEAGTGKSTIINIIQKLFDGYYVTFDAKSLGSAGNQFATEAFRSDPLVAVQHDGDLSRIEDNTRINSIVSHEMMTIKEKFKPEYTSRANCFLFMGTNRPVKITDAKSGIIRRLIDIHPSGNTLKPHEYDAAMSQIDFELGAIAWHCLQVYRDLGKNYYKSYMPKDMIMKTDVFYNFVEACQDIFIEQTDGISLKQAYSIYKDYCEDALVEYKMPRYRFREELKDYFDVFEDVTYVNGKHIRSWFRGFKKEKFEAPVLKREEKSLSLVLDCEESLLDDILADCPAQYAKPDGSPLKSWNYVKTTLRDIDTKKLHYVQPPLNHIVIDFDLKNDKGEKDMLMNLEAASKWPKTYAEFSKSGGGIHLHYIYDGDPDKLKSLYAPGIEIKVFRGMLPLRRRLSKCNNVPIAHIRDGLPVKEEKMIDVKAIRSQKKLVEVIKDCLNKKHHGHTKPEIDFIVKILDDAYASDLVYDVSDLEHDILVFAMHSSNNQDYCKKQIRKMKFKSKKEIDEASKTDKAQEDELVFFDIEVFPNLLLVNWKVAGESSPVIRMINPSPSEIEDLFRFKLVGFNCRKYDNHILYGRYLGLSVEALYDLSQRIIVEQAKDAFYPEAYNISYTDVYDFSSKKQSLKKFEIELGIHHQELGLPWDEPVPEDMWEKVAEYCDNDVIATEAVFNARKADFTARQILASVAGLTVNDTTNQLTTRIIFGKERKPQSQFNYRNMGDTQQAAWIWDPPEFTAPEEILSNLRKLRETERVEIDDISESFKAIGKDLAEDDEVYGWDKFTYFDERYRPIFPGYKYDFGRSIYRGEEVGEGGYVYAETGIHTNVALLDIASMHPSSIVAEELFGPEYTRRFRDILEARIAIKHGDFDRARTLLDGKLAPFLNDESAAKDLAQALKIAINSVYGLTSARFDNPFRDRRNVDNIVAKRGALFMVNLKHEVQKRGFTVAHIKTDSIKIPDATPDIIEFVMRYGKLYGYNFEHEATYDRMCLVNDAVYIARYAKDEWCQQHYGYIPSDNKKESWEWTATGAQFQQPYVFKTLFSGEPLTFDDLCENKNVSGGAIYLDMNEGLPDVEDQEKALEKLMKKYSVSQDDISAFEKDGVVPDRDFDGMANVMGDILGLKDSIASGHDYHFVGRAGLFCPVIPGCGGGTMYREKNGKYYAISGTKGYRWLEAEVVRMLHKEDDIDPTYHQGLASEAIKSINDYGNYEAFVSEKPYISKIDEPPFDLVPCGDGKYNTCLECPKYLGDDICSRGYSLANYVENRKGE